MERITSAQPPPCVPKHPSMDIADMQGIEFPIYVYKPRRGMKRVDENKETYKLPHRLIEKKRRDRINECIAQLKDLLPEHLKLTTLGHLEKAVVLELTLKHVKSQSGLLDQQQQKIIALQNDLQISKFDGVMLRLCCINQKCFQERLFLTSWFSSLRRSWRRQCGEQRGDVPIRIPLVRKRGPPLSGQPRKQQELTPSHVISHIQKVAAEVLHHQSSLHPEESIPQASEKQKKPAGEPQRASEGSAKNCVPVIQRTYPHVTGEQSGSDTDTDSGYGGEHEKRDPKAQWSESHAKEGGRKHVSSEATSGAIKQEGDEPRAKKSRSDSSEDEGLSGHMAGGPGSYMSFSPNQPPFCLPFYLIPPAAAAAAAYLPMLEKCWYPGGMPIIGSPGSLTHEMSSHGRAGSPVSYQDSPALHKALKQVSPLNLETKD
ncbi:hypothetical protein F7725_016554 [Dissostichus mawsoni]|uniref:BHLH domain-containing protein n=1 Tax=Dissostichus mawsoni TaxID=36200 RepID=A0A7J5Z3X1_DISMA|nr:hypothetical protein F7725_016554 [Dissostichus mawsoni]